MRTPKKATKKKPVTKKYKKGGTKGDPDKSLSLKKKSEATLKRGKKAVDEGREKRGTRLIKKAARQETRSINKKPNLKGAEDVELEYAREIAADKKLRLQKIANARNAAKKKKKKKGTPKKSILKLKRGGTVRKKKK